MCQREGWKVRPSPDEVNEGAVPIRGCGWSTHPKMYSISEAPLNTSLQLEVSYG